MKKNQIFGIKEVLLVPAHMIDAYASPKVASSWRGAYWSQSRGYGGCLLCTLSPGVMNKRMKNERSKKKSEQKQSGTPHTITIYGVYCKYK